MPKRSREPLEANGREIRFFKGDWEALAEILAHVKLTPSAFIREMTRKHLRAIQAKASLLAQPVEIPHGLTEDILRDVPREFPPGSGEREES